MTLLVRAGFLALAAAACGNVATNKLADAPAGDGARGSDAAIDAAPNHGNLTIHVLDPRNTGAPAVGVPVVFIDAAGTQTIPTNGSGDAIADVHADTIATSIAAVTNGFQLQTITGLQPGERAVIGQTLDTSALSPFVITAPNGPAKNLEAFGPCGASATVATSPTGVSTQLSIPLRADCMKSPALIEVLAMDSNFAPLSIMVVPDVVITPGNTQPTSLTAAYLTFDKLAGTFSNIDSVTNVSFARFSPNGNYYQNITSAPHTTGPLTLTVAGPPISGTVVAQSTLTSPSGQNTIRELVDSTATNYAFDGATKLLPFVGKPTFDLASGKLTVPVDATGTSGDAPDLFRAAVAYSRTTTVGTTTTTTQFTWLVYAAAPGDVTLPQIPTTEGMLMPQATDTVGALAVESLELDSIAGYAQARLDPIGTANHLNLAGDPGSTLVRFSLNQARLGVK